jgi:hypothetical protein
MTNEQLSNTTSAQHRVRWTLGILRHLRQAFFWLRVFSAPKQSPRQPSVQSTQTVDWFFAKSNHREKNMKNKTSQFSSILLFLAILLTSCNGLIAIEPTATITPTSTQTPIPPPTFTPTATPTLPPTETPIPQPASLSGTIFLSSDTAKPFVSLVELRQGDSFTLIASGETDSSGVYKIENIDPGIYGLWILITSKSTVISGCNDVAPPDDTWKIGIEFNKGKSSLSIENAYLTKALMLMEYMPSTSDLKAHGFFAALDDFKIASGIENKMDVTLICK